MARLAHRDADGSRRLHSGDFGYASTPGFLGGEKDGEHLMKDRGERLDELQEHLLAGGRSDGTRSMLLVRQGVDTSPSVRHVLGMVDPQGVQRTSSGVPTEEERPHRYLWRIERALPSTGQIGVVDRSHHEEVLVARIHHLVEAVV